MQTNQNARYPEADLTNSALRHRTTRSSRSFTWASFLLVHILGTHSGTYVVHRISRQPFRRSLLLINWAKRLPRSWGTGSSAMSQLFKDEAAARVKDGWVSTSVEGIEPVRLAMVVG